MMINSRGVVLAAFTILALNGEAMAGEVGKNCKVTAGPNTGKTGTYGDSGEWCHRIAGAPRSVRTSRAIPNVRTH
jgi:hypothetical protein